MAEAGSDRAGGDELIHAIRAENRLIICPRNFWYGEKVYQGCMCSVVARVLGEKDEDVIAAAFLRRMKKW